MDFDDLDAAGGCRLYDIVVYGATGMTGCLICEHLDAMFSQDEETAKKWAIAGRSPDKLKKMAKNCKTEPGVIEVREGENRKDDLELMCEMTTVVINVSGPYIIAGKDVVAACVEKNTHYLDVTGEVIYNRRMIDFYHKKAKEKGVMIIIMCGFMCAVGDASAYLLAKKLGPLKNYREYYMSTAAARGGGSFFSGFAQYEHMNISEPPLLNDPFALYGERKAGKRKEDMDTKDGERDPMLPEVWISPSFVGHPGMRIIRRSCHLFEQGGDDGVQYGESVVVASFDAFSNEMAASQNAVMTRQPEDVRKIMKNAETMEGGLRRGQGGIPGTGAPRETRILSKTEEYAVAEAEDGTKAYVHFEGPEGYEVTSLLCISGALTLLDEAYEVNAAERGGVVTPAYAFHGTTWLERANAMTFACRPGRNPTWDVVDGELDQKIVMDSLHANDAHSGMFQMKLMSGEIKGAEVPELLAGK
mmetsp:Transcript_11840/g.27004  ORF Transcript_11840/g.27004 Transcript_11840/m.27004 type:complete len:473 (+) Transcript_11840:81-1499(+)